ncbi:hypothetical protein M406DRAFT_67399 [Cryphonectria parasitica EP155]|uniref:Myb-like domain-containing protein n=1 Tax=Cryphonectria parasitica (strain ATCC 38755 / EP155) TaxID=660469 RepID=A0A9P5CWD8_CRYP1|nr:uncharacterized protein M406DRAFT_67399 [Cryphonectria parasitica EP155]KAF3771065.1 hypothetical protein M406DRAFT_67399 [Cryphonectria parasitica EP155]
MAQRPNTPFSQPQEPDQISDSPSPRRVNPNDGNAGSVQPNGYQPHIDPRSLGNQQPPPPSQDQTHHQLYQRGLVDATTGGQLLYRPRPEAGPAPSAVGLSRIVAGPSQSPTINPYTLAGFPQCGLDYLAQCENHQLDPDINGFQQYHRLQQPRPLSGQNESNPPSPHSSSAQPENHNIIELEPVENPQLRPDIPDSHPGERVDVGNSTVLPEEAGLQPAGHPQQDDDQPPAMGGSDGQQQALPAPPVDNSAEPPAAAAGPSSPPPAAQSGQRAARRRRSSNRRGQARPGAWTADELQRARALREQGLSIAHIAREMGRTANSVSARLWRLSGGNPRRAENERRAHGDARPDV